MESERVFFVAHVFVIVAGEFEGFVFVNSCMKFVWVGVI